VNSVAPLFAFVAAVIGVVVQTSHVSLIFWLIRIIPLPASYAPAYQYPLPEVLMNHWPDTGPTCVIHAVDGAPVPLDKLEPDEVFPYFAQHA
jgi:hypothetical protein